ncbi:MAG: hypothetical protein FGM43_08260 [Sinobacteraceae bacterium]|nr:hypothetical protein [Nevskiaceae bacterium]
MLSFKRHALLVSADPFEAGWSLLHAAWVADDLNDRALASDCREGCADLWAGAVCSVDEDGLRHQTVLVDVLRRSEHFDEAEALVDRLLPHPSMTPEISRVLQFQKRLISRFDVDGYTCEQAFAAIPQDNPTLQH